jgi:hypothetical protein
MTVSAGTKLGPYEILSPLGAGRLGEVYRARDARLHREVAMTSMSSSRAVRSSSPASPSNSMRGLISSDQYRSGYDVTADGKRFIMVKLPEGSAPRRINVIVNWFEELRRRVSTDKKVKK